MTNYEGWFKVSKVYNFEEEKFGWKVYLPHSCDEWVIANGTHEPRNCIPWRNRNT